MKKYHEASLNSNQLQHWSGKPKQQLESCQGPLNIHQDAYWFESRDCWEPFSKKSQSKRPIFIRKWNIVPVRAFLILGTRIRHFGEYSGVLAATGTKKFSNEFARRPVVRKAGRLFVPVRLLPCTATCLHRKRDPSLNGPSYGPFNLRVGSPAPSLNAEGNPWSKVPASLVILP